MLSAEELLAGSALTFDVNVPTELLDGWTDRDSPEASHAVNLRPLTVRDLQLVSRAAKENDTLVATLMVQIALVEPKLTVAQVSAMQVGLMQFLLQEVNRISGITTSNENLTDAAEAPLVKAAFILAREFGWTPQQVNELTLGQVLLHMQMLKEKPQTDGNTH